MCITVEIEVCMCLLPLLILLSNFIVFDLMTMQEKPKVCVCITIEKLVFTVSVNHFNFYPNISLDLECFEGQNMGYTYIINTYTGTRMYRKHTLIGFFIFYLQLSSRSDTYTRGIVLSAEI